MKTKITASPSFLLLSLFLIVLSPCLAFAKTNILVLHSYDLDYEWASNVQKGIRESLKDLPSTYDVHYEFMDTRRLRDKDFFLQLADWFKQKYKGTNFEIVLTVDDNAYNFFLSHDRMLFPNADLFFCGKGTFDESEVKNFPNQIFGVLEYIDLLSNLKLGGKLHKTKKVYYIVDASTTGTVQYEKWMKVFKEAAPDFQIIPLNLKFLTHEELLQKVKTLNDGFIIMNVVGQDRLGNVVGNLTMTKKIVEASQIPIYVESRMRIGTGVVGGRVIDGAIHGQRIGKKLIAFVSKAPVSSPNIELDTNRYIFDFVALEHFNIELSDLPEHSIILNRPKGFYYQHRQEIVVISIIVLILLLLILVQTYRIRVKKKFQHDLEKLVEVRTEELNKQIDQQTKLRKVLIAREKLASLGSLTAGIAHEIKNPLNIILNSAISIEKRLQPLNDEADKRLKDSKRMVELIIKSSYRADSIINNMLGQAKSDTASPTIANLNDLLDEALGLVYHASRSKYDFNVEIEKAYKDTLVISVVKENFLRAFINIFENSLYAIYQKHLLAPHFQAKIKVETEIKNDSAIIEINDNGTGIPEAILSKAQMPFFTTKPPGEGTGLGLSMVYDIVTSHRGELEILSTEGEFTTIRITLPYLGHLYE